MAQNDGMSSLGIAQTKTNPNKSNTSTKKPPTPKMTIFVFCKQAKRQKPNKIKAFKILQAKKPPPPLFYEEWGFLTLKLSSFLSGRAI